MVEDFRLVGTTSRLDRDQTRNADLSLLGSWYARVPVVYPSWANWVFLAFFAFNGINNLRASNVAFSSIPTAAHPDGFRVGEDEHLIRPITITEQTENSGRDNPFEN